MPKWPREHLVEEMHRKKKSEREAATDGQGYVAL